MLKKALTKILKERRHLPLHDSIIIGVATAVTVLGMTSLWISPESLVKRSCNTCKNETNVPSTNTAEH